MSHPNIAKEVVLPNQVAKPFLKWAGGKGQLLDQLAELFPPELRQGRITSYVEPFVGAGALFFHLAQFPGLRSKTIIDVNPDLILTYRTIKTSPERLIDRLQSLQSQYLDHQLTDQEKLYYQVRKQFNETLGDLDYEHFSPGWIERSAQLVFLNRTCFNGLFRVNAKGRFNVPFGRYRKPNICTAGNIRAVASCLQAIDILCGDFTQSASFVDKNTFVYFDPPYRPISQSASFTSYSASSFSDDDQIRLAKYFALLDKKGAKLMLSNSDPKNADPHDNFFDHLYTGYKIRRLPAKRIINCDATKRGNVFELVVTNY